MIRECHDHDASKCRLFSEDKRVCLLWVVLCPKSLEFPLPDFSFPTVAFSSSTLPPWMKTRTFFIRFTARIPSMIVSSRPDVSLQQQTAQIAERSKCKVESLSTWDHWCTDVFRLVARVFWISVLTLNIWKTSTASRAGSEVCCPHEVHHGADWVRKTRHRYHNYYRNQQQQNLPLWYRRWSLLWSCHAKLNEFIFRSSVESVALGFQPSPQFSSQLPTPRRYSNIPFYDGAQIALLKDGQRFHHWRVKPPNESLPSRYAALRHSQLRYPPLFTRPQTDASLLL